MLQNWVTNSIGRPRGPAFSFADRGDIWAQFVGLTEEPRLDHTDHATVAEGLIAGTLVATEQGWQPVQDLQPGDRVVTFDNGMQRLKAVRVSTLWTAAAQAPRGLWPLRVPPRALGNRTEIVLLPEQVVLIESDAAETLYGDPFGMVAAGALDGYKGIERTPPAREMTVVTLEFTRDEVVYANGTTLVHCPAPTGDLLAQADTALRVGPGYRRLTDVQTRRLVEAMHAA